MFELLLCSPDGNSVSGQTKEQCRVLNDLCQPFAGDVENETKPAVSIFPVRWNPLVIISEALNHSSVTTYLQVYSVFPLEKETKGKE